MAPVREEVTTNLLLEKLKTSWFAPALTLKQTQQRQEIFTAKIPWADVLTEFREKKEDMVSKIGSKEIVEEKNFEELLLFLDLPVEICNTI
jgi:hypothetical protein